MLEPTSSRFWQAALQSGLADTASLQACWDTIPADKRTPEHIDRRLARAAVQANVLTLWQAQQLIAGRSTGFKVDRYVLIDLIGQGGMGRVYLARDSRLNRRVAVKILSPERVNNPRAIARFQREAMVGAQLQHENLVRIYDEGEANGKCYLVMEYIEGKNIGQMIAENGPIPPAVAARLGRQVALGLEHAQRKGLIHRDVNPYNILVTRDGIAKLTDLGLAIDLADQDRVTRDGATVGTFDYVSPEQARHSHSVDTRSDIYSLGCTLYHMLTGQVPFPSASLPEKLFSHQASEPEPIRSLAPDVPEALEAVVARMMRKSPDDRYATPLDVAQALEPFADVPHGPDPGAASRSGVRLDASVTHISNPTADAAVVLGRQQRPRPRPRRPPRIGARAVRPGGAPARGRRGDARDARVARRRPGRARHRAEPRPRAPPAGSRVPGETRRPRPEGRRTGPRPRRAGSNDDGASAFGINLNAGAEPPAARPATRSLRVRRPRARRSRGRAPHRPRRGRNAERRRSSAPASLNAPLCRAALESREANKPSSRGTRHRGRGAGPVGVNLGPDARSPSPPRTPRPKPEAQAEAQGRPPPPPPRPAAARRRIRAGVPRPRVDRPRRNRSQAALVGRRGSRRPLAAPSRR